MANIKDNLLHNTCTYQIYVKPHLKNTQMTLELVEYQIFDEKALE